MADLIDLSKIIAKKGDKPLLLSSVNLQSQEDAVLERKLRELKSKQESFSFLALLAILYLL